MSAKDPKPYSVSGVSKPDRTERWTSCDTGWLFNLFGTAVGAGVLYLPITAGRVGFVSLLLIAFLVVPVIFFSHRNMTRFCQEAPRLDANITVTMNDAFGEKVGVFLNLTYFFSIYPILLLYAVSLTNITEQFISNQMAWTPPHRSVTSFILLLVLATVLSKSQHLVLSAVEALVMPLVVILVGVSLYLIPQWHLDKVFVLPGLAEMIKSVFIVVPLLVFSFNHSPACSAFAQAYRMAHHDKLFCVRKTDRILAVNTVLLMVVVMLFVFSCMLALTPAEIQAALKDNVPVLTVFANRGGASFFAVIASIIAFLAITSSFVGTYMGSIEGVGFLFSMVSKQFKLRPFHSASSVQIVKSVMFLSCWLAACLNLNVIDIIDGLLAPLLAVILIFMPVCAYYTIPALKHYRHCVVDVITVVSGVVVIIGFVASKWLL